MAYELIRFTLADPYLEDLKNKQSGEDQSIHLTAKRLLIEFLKGDRPAPAGTITPDELEKLRDRLGEIEERLAAIESGEIDRIVTAQLERSVGIESGEPTATRPNIMTPDEIRKFLGTDRPRPATSTPGDQPSEDPTTIVDSIRKLMGTEKQAPVIRAIGPGDREKFVICEVADGRPVRYWGGEDWTSHLLAANRYQSESSLRRTLDKLTKRKRENPEIPIRYNTIGAIERLLEKSD